MNISRLQKWAIGAAAANFLLVLAIFHPFFEQLDTSSYIATARLIFGLPGGSDSDFRLVKPLALLFPGALEWLTGLSAQYGFFLQNIIFYFLSVWLLFKIVTIVFHDEWQAFLSTLIFITSPAVLFFGFSYLTDMTGWFFAILGTYLTVRYFEKLTHQTWLAFWLMTAIGTGFLFKESAVAGAVFFGFFVLLSPLLIARKIKIVLAGAIGFLLPVLISCMTVYLYFSAHDSLLEWYAFVASKPYGDTYNFSQFAFNIIRTFLTHWLLFIMGMAIFFQQKNVAEPTRRFLIATAATLPLCLLWPYPHFRIFFMTSVFLVGMASRGAAAYDRKKGLWLTLASGLINFVAVTLFAYFPRTPLPYASFGLLMILYGVWAYTCWAKRPGKA